MKRSTITIAFAACAMMAQAQTQEWRHFCPDVTGNPEGAETVWQGACYR